MTSRSVVNLLFAILPIIFLAGASYASMGEISVCFPFFLLLALLMAGMIAQGKSPLIGFDISVMKPPAEIKSTSYHVKTFTSGGYGTDAKARDAKGGGTHLSRGTGKVAQGATRAAGYITSKVTRGKYGTKMAKQGTAFTKTWSQRGVGFAASSRLAAKGKKSKALSRVVGLVAAQGLKNKYRAVKTGVWGGGELGNLEFNIQKDKGTVKSLRQQLGYALLGSAAGAVAVTLLTSKMSEYYGLKAKEKDLKTKLKDRAIKPEQKRKLQSELEKVQGRLHTSNLQLRAAREIEGKQARLEVLTDKEKSKKPLSRSEKNELKSLKNELGSLQNGYSKLNKNQRKAKNLFNELNSTEQRIRMYESQRKKLSVTVDMLDKESGAMGRAAAMGAVFAAPVMGAGLLASSTAKSLSQRAEKKKLEKELSANETKPLTEDERKRMDKLIFIRKERMKKGIGELPTTQQKKLDLLIKRDRYSELNKRGTLSAVFNPVGLRGRRWLSRAAKINAYGVYSAVKDIGPFYYANRLWNAGVGQRDKIRQKKLNKGLDTAADINKTINELKLSTGDEKYQLAKKLDSQLKQLQKSMRNKTGDVVKVLLSKDSKKVAEAMAAVTAANATLANLSSKSAELNNKLIALNKENNAAKNKVEIDRIRIELKGMKKEIKTNENNLTSGVDNMNLLLFGAVPLAEKYQAERKSPSKAVAREYQKIKKGIGKVDEKFDERVSKLKNDELKLNNQIDDKLRQINNAGKDKAKVKSLQNQIYDIKDARNEIRQEIKALEYVRYEEEEKFIRKERPYGVGVREKIELSSTKEKKKEISSVYGKFTQSEEEQRAAMVGYARLKDWYTEKVNSGNFFAKQFDRSIQPFQNTQRVRALQNEYENVVGPKMTLLRSLKEQREMLLRDLKNSEEKKSMTDNFKANFKEMLFLPTEREPLNVTLKKLTEQSKDLQKQRKELLKDAATQKDPKKASELKEKAENLGKDITSVDKHAAEVKAVINSKKIELTETNTKMNQLMNSFIYEDALLIQRQIQHQASQESDNALKRKRLEKELDDAYEERISLENMQNMTKDPKESKKLRDKHEELEVSIKKKENDIKKIDKETQNKLSELNKQLGYTTRNLSIRAGAEELIKDQGWLRNEYDRTKVDPQATPNVFVVERLMDIFKDDPSYREKVVKYYGSKKGREELKSNLKTLLKTQEDRYNELNAVNWNQDPSYNTLKTIQDLGVGNAKDKTTGELLEFYKNHNEEYRKELTAARESLNKKVEETQNILNKNAAPNAHVIGLLESAGVINIADKLSKYYMDNPGEYGGKEGDILKARNILREKYANLEKVNFADWLRKTIDKVGEPQWGRESDLHRERFEMSKLLKIVNDPHLQKELRLKEELGFEITPELKEYVEKNYSYVNSKLYTYMLATRGSIPFGTALEYDKRFDEIDAEKGRMNSELESQMLSLKIELNKGDLQNASKSGWKQETEKLNNIISGQISQKDKLDKLSVGGIDRRINDLQDKRQELLDKADNAENLGVEAEAARLYSEAGKIDKQITPLEKQHDEFTNKMDKAVDDARIHKLAFLMMREDSIKKNYGEDKFKDLTQPDTIDEKKLFREMYPESTNRTFWAKARYWENYYTGKDISDQRKGIIQRDRDEIEERKKKIADVSKDITDMNSKYGAPMPAQMSEEDKEKYNNLIEERANLQKELTGCYNELHYHKEQFGADTGFGRTGPNTGWEKTKALFRHDSETSEVQYFRDLQLDLEENMATGRLAAVAAPVSKAVSKVLKGFYEHGQTALNVAVVASPLLLPISPALALTVDLGGASALVAKSAVRKAAEWDEFGYPGATGFDSVTSEAWHGSRFASHFTARGSGSPPKITEQAWRTMLEGNENLLRGFRLNEEGEAVPYKEGLTTPYEELPLHVRIVKSSVDSTAVKLAEELRMFTLYTNYFVGRKTLAKDLAENKNVMPEVKKKIQYQYTQLYGSIEPFTNPKAAWVMNEDKILSLSVPWQEQARGYNYTRTAGVNPGPYPWSSEKKLARDAGATFRFRREIERQLDWRNDPEYRRFLINMQRSWVNVEGGS